MSVNPSEAKLFELFAAQAAANPPRPLTEQTLNDFRAGTGVFLQYAGKHADIKYRDEFVPARDGYSIPIRIFNSDLTHVAPVIVMYPGCGYVFDLFEANSIACSRIAKYLGIKVVLVNYRLAPEYPLPIANYDGYDATKYIATHAEQFQIDASKIFIIGLSSGANCAAVVANLARSEHQFSIHHQILLNGVFDFSQSSHGYDEYEAEDKLCSREVHTFIINQYGFNPADYKNPLFSPFFETDLKNLPPTTFIVAEYDGIRNDSESYYKKIKEAQNKVEKILLSGQTHNTIILREAMSDGEDPAKVIADVVMRETHNEYL